MRGIGLATADREEAGKPRRPFGLASGAAGEREGEGRGSAVVLSSRAIERRPSDEIPIYLYTISIAPSVTKDDLRRNDVTTDYRAALDNNRFTRRRRSNARERAATTVLRLKLQDNAARKF